MLKVWGRNTSANVQKVMWAIGELGLACERIDIAGPFGKNRDPAYLAMNPNGLVPTLEEDDFLLWESNAIVRYLAAKFGAGTLEPSDPRARARAGQWMDWQLTVAGPAIFPVFWGLVRTPVEQRDPKAIEAGKAKTVDAMSILNGQLMKTAFVAGDTFSCGDIPVGNHLLSLRHAGGGAAADERDRSLVYRIVQTPCLSRARNGNSIGLIAFAG